MEPNASVDLQQGTVRYRDTGGDGEPIVFVHGLLVNGSLWRKVIPALRSAGYRCIAPDWPLGSHRPAMKPDADNTPRGVAHLIADFLAALDLWGVTIVANDTGGAIAQLLVTERSERVGRLVLTPCDCYENFLPPAFRPLQWLARVPGALMLLMQPMRVAAIRRSPRVGFGMLTREPIEDDVTDGWVRPFLADGGVRRDTIRLLRAIDARDTLAAAEKLRSLQAPTLLAWSPKDRFFKIAFAQRLADAIPNARLVRMEDSYTFVPEDEPQRLAQQIEEFIQATPIAGQVAGTTLVAD
ncbi:MAG TPA: alpha/beta hydrolase [Solirubrobacteraceae bacterium]|nr:alpha/beta hydrolase [Solirubrobacteraceae bacterium]